MIIRIKRTKNISICSINDIVQFIFLLGVFLKQFYVFESGSIQPGDVFVFISFIIACIFRITKLYKIDITMFIFVLCSFVINLFYYAIYHRGFIIASVFLLYNLMAIMLFRSLIYNDLFVKRLTSVLKLNLVSQMLIFVSGLGKNFGGGRYEGSFNDPNQFGFFVLCNFFLLYLSNKYSGRKVSVFWYIICAILILLSASSGMIIAIGLFSFFAILSPILETQSFKKKIFYSVLFFVVLLILYIIYINIIPLLINDSGIYGIGNTSIERIQNKINNGTNNNIFYSFIRDRGMVRVIKTPEYFIFGCGEGNFERFLPISGEAIEIHSTLIALFYYYGLIPYLFFVRWIYNNIKKCPKTILGIYIALLFEAFTLANHRQLLFWIIFVMCSTFSSKANQLKEKVDS